MNSNEFTRRSFFRHVCYGTLGLAGSLTLQPALPAEAKKTTLTPDEALAKLKKGNADSLADKPRVLPQDHDRRLEIARGQNPFAVLVCCSDSRVPPELLFGARLGELFIVRNAGNTVDTVALGSIQYGVLVLGVPLIVVLGHERCGAVQAALEVVQGDASFPGSIGQMIEPIIPAALRATRAGDLRGRPPLRRMCDEPSSAFVNPSLPSLNRCAPANLTLLVPITTSTTARLTFS
jgi:carbonic anhydrase